MQVRYEFLPETMDEMLDFGLPVYYPLGSESISFENSSVPFLRRLARHIEQQKTPYKMKCRTLVIIIEGKVGRRVWLANRKYISSRQLSLKPLILT